MRVLVTGGAGFVGSHVVRRFLRDTSAGSVDSVLVLDALTYAADPDRLAGERVDGRLELREGDVADPAAVRAAVQGCDLVVHLAAETHVDRSIRSAAAFVRTNVVGTQVVLDAVRDAGCRLLHVSTDEVYGPCEGGAFDEGAPLRPRNPYAASKAAAEHLVAASRDTYGLDAVVLRLSNVYGPDQDAEKLIPRMVHEVLAGRPVPLYGDGLQQRQWLHVADAAAAVRLLAGAAAAGEVLNVGGADVLANLDVARRVLRLLGADEGAVRHVADRPGHDRRYALDSSRVRQGHGWTPRVPFEDGLAAAVSELARRAPSEA